jgi:hypothetical protein
MVGATTVGDVEVDGEGLVEPGLLVDEPASVLEP